MALIQILPDFIANQIAAGEVVQRPESVVKELVENSLDSGAGQIAVIVRNSGKQLIHVVDNGSGMAREDIAIAHKRHSTSKIIRVEDLDAIRTFGFRGEALASIASVADLEMRSRQSDGEHGWKLLSVPMKQDVIEPVVMDVGTQVFVKNLFYNVPARRKFLKSDLTEFRYISDTMIKLALANPSVRFTFYDDETLIFDVHPADLQKRIGDVLGDSVSGSLLPLKHDNAYVSIRGFVGLPHIAKQSRAGQFLYLNGRSIISKSLSHAVFSSYEHLLENKANPFFVINISLDPAVVDVNVHPQKHEVKFEDERFIYNVIAKTVTTALRDNNLAPTARLDSFISQSPFERSLTDTGDNSGDMMLVNKMTGEVIDNNFKPHTFQGGAFSPSHQHYTPPINQGQDNFEFNRSQSAFDALFGRQGGAMPDFRPDNRLGSAHQSDGRTFYFWQLHKKYIFFQTDSGVMVIDQHAAHERVLYEKAIRAMNSDFAYMQKLLFPVPVRVNASEYSVLQQIEDEIGKLGYEIQKVSEQEIELTSVPADVQSGEEEATFREILDQFRENNAINQTARRDYLAATYSCKAAIKTGQSLKFTEIKQLLEDLFKCNMPYSCPHGRPVVIEFPLTEFDKRFGRI